MALRILPLFYWLFLMMCVIAVLLQFSSGFSDLGVQFEYAFYEDSDLFKTKQATVVAGVTFPTGSYTKHRLRVVVQQLIFWSYL